MALCLLGSHWGWSTGPWEEEKLSGLMTQGVLNEDCEVTEEVGVLQPGLGLTWGKRRKGVAQADLWKGLWDQRGTPGAHGGLMSRVSHPGARVPLPSSSGTHGSVVHVLETLTATHTMWKERS